MTLAEVATQVCHDLTNAAGGDEAVLLLYDDLAPGLSIVAACGNRGSDLVRQPVPDDLALQLLSHPENDETPEGSISVPAEWGGGQFGLVVRLRTDEPVGMCAIFSLPGRTLNYPRDAARDAARRLLAARPDTDHTCLFRTIVELDSAGVAVVEGTDALVTYASTTFRELVGAGSEPLLGRPLAAALPELPGPYLDAVRQVLLAAQPLQQSGIEVRDSLSTRYLDLHAIPQTARDGSVHAIYLALWNRSDVVVSRRSLLETAAMLEESQSALMALLDATHNGIIFAGTDYQVLYANRRMREFFGLDPLELLDQDIRDVVRQDMTPLVADAAAFETETMAGWQRYEVPLEGDVALERPTPRILERYAAPVYRRDGRLYGRIEVYTDVTEARNLQRNKDQFLSLISHQLRTPITSIKGYAQLLRRRAQRDELPADTMIAYEVIERQAQRMQELIDGLLDLTRLETGRLALQVADLDLVALARRVIDMQAPPTFTSHELRLDAPDEPLIIAGDEQRLDQVLTNLLTNAMLYSPEGSTVSVRLRPLEGNVSIAISDHGAGIPAEALPHIFERFYRAPGIAESTGMGIGLYIARGIVEQHSGAIEVQSRVGQGTTVTVTLPRDARHWENVEPA